jgi:hypothetical protein
MVQVVEQTQSPEFKLSTAKGQKKKKTEKDRKTRKSTIMFLPSFLTQSLRLVGGSSHTAPA